MSIPPTHLLLTCECAIASWPRWKIKSSMNWVNLGCRGWCWREFQMLPRNRIGQCIHRTGQGHANNAIRDGGSTAYLRIIHSFQSVNYRERQRFPVVAFVYSLSNATHMYWVQLQFPPGHLQYITDRFNRLDGKLVSFKLRLISAFGGEVEVGD